MQSFPITISFIGTTGVGKSAVANGFFLGKPSRDQVQKFKTSSLSQACTMQSVANLGRFFHSDDPQSEGPQIQLVDNAGLMEGQQADILHNTQTIQLHKQLKFVSLFCLVLNGAEPRYSETTRQSMQQFRDSFGENLWSNLCIVITRWSNNPYPVGLRAEQDPPLTEELKKDGILAQIHNDFEDSRNKEIVVYFTDVFEIGGQHDKTTQVMAEIVAHAYSNPFFDTEDCHACNYPQWRERRPLVLARAEELETQVKLHYPNELASFKKQMSDQITSKIEDVSKAKKLSQVEYDDLVNKLEGLFQLAQAEDARKKLAIETEKARKEMAAKKEQERLTELARLETIRVRDLAEQQRKHDAQALAQQKQAAYEATVAAQAAAQAAIVAAQEIAAKQAEIARLEQAEIARIEQEAAVRRMKNRPIIRGWVGKHITRGMI